MPAGRSNASALLQKVNSQLRGERVPLKTKEEDELANYLNSLTKKTQEARTLNFEEYGDISISSGADARNAHTPRGRRSASPASPAPTAAGSKFLKKKKPAEEEVAVQSSYDDDQLYDGGNKGLTVGGKHQVKSSQFMKKTSALDKASALSNKIKGRSSSGPPLRRVQSGDSESETSLRGSDVGRRPGSADQSIGRDGPKFLKSRGKGDADSRAGVRSPSPQGLVRSSSVEKRKKSKKANKNKGEIERTLGTIYLTSEEESLADFIQGLSASESTAKRQPQNLVAKKQQKWRKKTTSPGMRQSPSPVQRSRSPSPFKRSPSPFGKQLSRSQSQDSDLQLSLQSEIVEDNRGRANSVDSDDPLNINLMDVASLIPVSPRPRSASKTSKGSRRKKKESQSSGSPFKASSSGFKASSSYYDDPPQKGKKNKAKKSSSKGEKRTMKKSDSKSSLFENLGIHMVDELLDNNRRPDADNYLTDDSEIKTERSDDRRMVARRRDSESEIITVLGGEKSMSRNRLSTKADSISERIGIDSYRPRKPSVSDETDVDYTESFLSDSETPTRSFSPAPRRKDSRSRGRHTYRSDSYSQDSRRGRERKIVMEEKRVDVSTVDHMGSTHHWNRTQTGVSVSGPYGLQYVDPKPVATHVINADALETLTSYSPNVLALQEMMRAQLELVQNFVNIQNRIYQSCMDGLSYDHKYTTLEDTKEYIRKNRKPKMTFKEALKLVEQEEGLVT